MGASGVTVRPVTEGDWEQEWRARARSGAITLHVHEDDPRAWAACARRGCVATGITVPYALDAAQRELEVTNRLR